MKTMKILLATLLLAGAATAVAATPDTGPVDAALPLVTVHKSAYCGCCVKWVEHMQAAGFTVEVVETENMTPVKQRVGIPPGKASCHTAEVDGYFVEGHVPADDVKRLLAEKPEARGIVVPGMPIGSPGMESPDGRVQAYEVQLIDTQGVSSVWSRQGQAD
ncbi:DUF411 domain-containing protein [Arenimonas alkanexedens]